MSSRKPLAATLVVAGVAALFWAARCTGPAGPAPDAVQTDGGVQLKLETVVQGLSTVWDMTWAPDGAMWISERGGRISRIDVTSRKVEVVGQLQVLERSESGLLGIALHPDFATTPLVYAVHTYADATGAMRNRLVRMRYENGRLGPPEVLLAGLRGGSNHNGSRLAIGPDRLLYMTMGEVGDAALAQEDGALNGKILRLTLDGAPAPGNPLGSAVWSTGHRNPQGLVFQPGTGVLYSSEHGPSTDDEINVIERGRNYGWPTVAGFCDRAEEKSFCSARQVVEPVHAWTPTVAVSGADFYTSDRIPGWKGNLLVGSLGGSSLWRIVLSPDGRKAASVERLLQGELGRIRDVLVGADGSVYLATSNRDGRGSPRAEDDRIVRLTP